MYVADAKVVSLEPNTIEDIFENIKTVGELCGVAEKAGEVVQNLQNRLDEIRQKTEKSEKSPRVFMLEWLEPPFAPGHWTPEQVEIAGGICLLGEAGEKSVTTTYRGNYRIKAGDFGFNSVRLLHGRYFAAIAEHEISRESFKEIPAFQNDEIWALDATSYFSRPAPRVVDGVEILAKIFHPEIFGAAT